MRLANINGRATILDGDALIDVARRSAGEFGPELPVVFARWSEFHHWALTIVAGAEVSATASLPVGVDMASCGPPSPEPRQIFAVGMNYHDHVNEIGAEMPTVPTIFTKFCSSLTGPSGEIPLSSKTVDWEVELVVVIGRETRRVAEAEAWSAVAGLTIGQDLSDRVVQWHPPVPQFSMGKSFECFGPVGPVLVTVDEFVDPDDLGIVCEINGQAVQRSRTSQMIFSVPQLIAWLSQVVTLYPGDMIFTGTPAGVGAATKPPRYLAEGDQLISSIEQIGTMRHSIVAAHVDSSLIAGS